MTVLMLAAVLAVPAAAGAQVGRLVGFLVRPTSQGRGQAKAHARSQQRPQTLHLVLTSGSGHKRQIAVGHAGRFSLQLPAGHYAVCDTTGAGACHRSSCPVTLVGTRFGPTGQSPPVSTIVILPKLKTHIQVTCST
ncbi:MAG TPA: hypothetical protein VGI87_04540 [Solirubrobacteraceae bacterium]